ncbi:MAG: histidine kinase dimerization/phospho-acceptor domain-containing protein [Nitrososphaeraceae archaeon]
MKNRWRQRKCRIQPIIGLSELLKSSRSNTSQEQQFLEIIINNAKRLQKLADKILDATKIEANLLKLNRSKFDINELVIKVSTEYQHIIDKENCKEDLKIITESSDLAILVEADRIKITPVMYDLIDNAIKFTNNGNIHIR